MFKFQTKFHKKEGYEHWENVFKKYTQYTDLYIKVYSEQYKNTDAPYWNGERTNIGLLASSCWKNNWIAIEEFSTTKKRKKENAKKVKGSGRCDLWVSSQDGEINYAIEAKKGRCSLDSNIMNKLDKLLVHACKDAGELTKSEGDKRMGLAFLHLYLPISKTANIESYIKNLKKDLIIGKGECKPDFIYIYLKNNGVKSESYIIPGVVIAGKVI